MTQGSLLTHHSSGSAKVSNGTTRVAMMAAKTTVLPRHRMRDSANAARLLTTRPTSTVTAVMAIELIRKRAAGTVSNTPV
jgi:hypothetical protein